MSARAPRLVSQNFLKVNAVRLGQLLLQIARFVVSDEVGESFKPRCNGKIK